jgi:hypothetical protein
LYPNIFIVLQNFGKVQFFSPLQSIKRESYLFLKKTYAIHENSRILSLKKASIVHLVVPMGEVQQDQCQPINYSIPSTKLTTILQIKVIRLNLPLLTTKFLKFQLFKKTLLVNKCEIMGNGIKGKFIQKRKPKDKLWNPCIRTTCMVIFFNHYFMLYCLERKR